MIDKHTKLDWAEVIDSWRVFPRLFLFACFGWTVDITHTLLAWYMHIPKDERGLETSGFASVVFLGVFGFLKLVYGTYSDAGRDWSARSGAQTSQTTISQTTSTPAASIPAPQS